MTAIVHEILLNWRWYAWNGAWDFAQKAIDTLVTHRDRTARLERRQPKTPAED